MPLTFRLVKKPSSTLRALKKVEIFTWGKMWRFWYSPPWTLITHLIQFFLIIKYSYVVLKPSIRSLYGTFSKYEKYFFPETNDNVPYTDLQGLQTSVDSFGTKVLHNKENSFHRIEFVDSNIPYYYRITWTNGSTMDITNNLNLSINMFYHINSLELNSRFYLYNDFLPNIGCTKWLLQIVIYKATSFSFKHKPTLRRSTCPDNSVSYNFEKSMDNDELADILQAKYVKPIRKNQYPHFINLNHISTALLFTSAFEMTVIINNFITKFYILHYKMKEYADFNVLNPLEQFHSTIGLWDSFCFIQNIFSIFSALVGIVDAQKLTQYPSSFSIHVFGLSALLICSGLLRWMSGFGRCYLIVTIIRSSFFRIMTIFLSQSPFLVSMIFISIFIFGAVTRVAESMISLIELILCLIFGDNIYIVYQSFTDGFYTYNWHCFIFVSLMTIILMWLFFPLYTALIHQVYKEDISELKED